MKMKRNETFQAAYYKECMKQKSTNMIICPNTTELPYETAVGVDTPALNRKLKYLQQKYYKKEEEKERKKGKER